MTNKGKTIIIILLVCVIIAIVPLALNKRSDFGGADGIAQDEIIAINPEYKPWFEPVLTPPGGETESLLFCLQAAIGAGIFGFGLGTLKERSKQRKAIT